MHVVQLGTHLTAGTAAAAVEVVLPPAFHLIFVYKYHLRIYPLPCDPSYLEHRQARVARRQ